MPKIIPVEKLHDLLSVHSQKEAAAILGCCVDTLRKSIRFHKIKYKHKGRSHKLRMSLPKKLTTNQRQVFIGCMLGDGHVDKRGRFKLEQSERCCRYVDDLFALFSPFSTALKTQKVRKPDSEGRIDDDHWSGEFLFKRRFQTYKCDVFERMRERWYPDGAKHIPKDLVLTPASLLHWMCQDGSNTYGMVRLHTNSFTFDEVDFLIFRLRVDLGISSHVTSQDDKPVIVVGSRDNGSNRVLIDLLQPMVEWSCFEHKVYWDESIKRRVGSVASS